MEKEFPDAEIFQIKKVELKNPIIFAGFVGAGLVGPLSITHMIEELKMADVYSKNSHIILKGHLNDTDVSSGFTDAHWTFNLKVSNGAGESYTIIHKRKYKSSFLGGIACGNDMPKSFLPTIQELVGKVINHPKFDGLFKEKKI